MKLFTKFEFMFALVDTIKERNRIEREKLEFQMKTFEFDKQINLENIKVNSDISKTLASYSEMIQNMNRTIQVLSDNDRFLKQEIDKLKQEQGGNNNEQEAEKEV